MNTEQEVKAGLFIELLLNAFEFCILRLEPSEEEDSDCFLRHTPDSKTGIIDYDLFQNKVFLECFKEAIEYKKEDSDISYEEAVSLLTVLNSDKEITSELEKLANLRIGE